MRQNPKQDPLVASVEDFIARRRLIARGSTVVAAVSGGADSVAMLAVLRDLSRRHRWRLIVAHLDHSLRNDSRQDAEFVRRLAKRWGLRCAVERVDVAAAAREQGQSVELAARRARYDFLERVAIEHKARFVACAHHADDNVETVLYRILRGTHIRGLAGIPASRALVEGRARILLVRPMLEVRRQEIEEFCRRRRLTWRTDSTNADVTYRRNFIRHRLLPTLRREINPDVDAAVLAIARAAGDVEKHVSSLAGELLESATIEFDRAAMVLDRSKLLSADPLIRTSALREAMERMRMPMQAVGRAHLEAMAELVAGVGAGAISLPGGWRLSRQPKRIVLQHAQEAPARRADEGEIELDAEGVTYLPDGSSIRCRTMLLDQKHFRQHLRSHPPGRELLDADEIRGRLFCRRRRAGDRFHPLGAGGSKSVSDFFTDSKLSAGARARTWCVCDERGIIYVLPLRIDQRVRIGKTTRRVLEISFEPRPRTSD